MKTLQENLGTVEDCRSRKYENSLEYEPEEMSVAKYSFLQNPLNYEPEEGGNMGRLTDTVKFMAEQIEELMKELEVEKEYGQKYRTQLVTLRCEITTKEKEIAELKGNTKAKTPLPPLEWRSRIDTMGGIPKNPELKNKKATEEI